jgi:hypothetical protein
MPSRMGSPELLNEIATRCVRPLTRKNLFQQNRKKWAVFSASSNVRGSFRYQYARICAPSREEFPRNTWVHSRDPRPQHGSNS